MTADEVATDRGLTPHSRRIAPWARAAGTGLALRLSLGLIINWNVILSRDGIQCDSNHPEELRVG